jgi:hypothetical protein
MVRSQWRQCATHKENYWRVKSTFRKSAMIGNPSTAINKSASATGRDASQFAHRQTISRGPHSYVYFGVRPRKVPVFAAENRELAPAVYLTKEANSDSWIAPDCALIIGRRRETI